MTLRIDPAGKEVRALARVTDWRGKRVLEIGCGDGRLTLRLARLGAQVYAIDPEAKLIRLARKNLPKRFTSRVDYHRGNAQALKHADGVFDLVVFAWAL
jgi:2-polyprenyl-6-hydroxyphenyl methylase/3-demethylubiquinone-9 3-methyltransferase